MNRGVGRGGDGGGGGENLRREITNLPNLVTISRVLLVPFVLLLIDNYNPLRTFLASMLYVGAAAGDALDGYLARKRNQVSVLGKFLDPLADKLIVTAVLVTMVALGRAPAWLVVVLIARDLAINGLRSIASAQGLVIAASDGGKIKTALQLVAIMMLLIHFQYPILGAESVLGTLDQRRLSPGRVDHAVPVDGGVRVLGRSVRPEFLFGGLAIAVTPDPVIVRSAPPLAPDEAARRVAIDADPIWLSSPGAGREAHTDVCVAFDVVAVRPHTVVRGESIADVERVWVEARCAWGASGMAAPGEVPIGVGWLSYDLARRWMPLPSRARNDHGWADIEFRFFDAVWIREVGAPWARIVARDQASADRLAATLDRASPLLAPPALGPLIAEQPRQRHAEAVARIQEYLRAGDAYQVNLARRLTATVGDGDPVWMAATLRARAPAPHAIWMAGPIDAGRSDRSLGRRQFARAIPARRSRRRRRDPADQGDASARRGRGVGRCRARGAWPAPPRIAPSTS